MMFDSPWWLLFALACLLPWFGPWRGTDRVQNVLRSVLFAAIAVGLARPMWLGDDANPQHVVVLDLSNSVDETARAAAIEKAAAYLEDVAKKDCHVVLYGDAQPSEKILERRFGTVSQLTSTAGGTSPLSAAIDRAATLVPRTSGGVVTVFSDGLATRPDDARAIAGLRERQIPIQVVELDSVELDPTPVRVEQESLRVGESGGIVVTIIANGKSIAGEVSLSIGDEVMATSDYLGGSAQQVRLEFEPPESGFVAASVSLTAGGRTASLPVTLAIDEPRQLLYVPGLQQKGGEELAGLLGKGVAVRTVDPEADPDGFRAALERSDLVMLDDCQADSIPELAEQSIIDSVTNEGLGLVMSGGRSSFGSGGWHDRRVESLLPVELVQKEEKRDPSTTLVVVIDTSGSMSGVRVQLAKEVARLAMRRLLPHDKVGIVEFYGAKRWAAPIQSASNAIELQRALNRMDAGGGTVILPALEEAFYGLQNVDTRYKHVLVITDGGVESGDFESLMRRMSGEGINVSTVLAGGGYHSEFLVNISNWGKGRFYNVPDRFNLPEVLLKQPSTAKLPAYRPGQHSVRARGGQGWWGDVDTSGIPSLAGYVETKSRPGSEILLETVKDRHPVITTWRYGAGRVTTIGTEPVGEGTRPWRQWPGYGEAIARILERSAADTRDPFHFYCADDGGQLQINAVRQLPRVGPLATAMPQGRVLSQAAGYADTLVRFTAKSPDHFVARIPAAGIGKEIRMECWTSMSPDRRRRIVAASPISRELEVAPDRGVDLRSLAAAAGGKVISLTGEWPEQTIKGQGKRVALLSVWFFAIALLLFLGEIIWRRRPQNET